MALNITLAQLKSDITPMLKGTSLRQVTDFYGTVAKAANRMLARISPEETRRTTTFTTPFWDNVNDYALPTDFKQGIDIRPQGNLRQDMPGMSNWSSTTPKQFNIFLSPDSYSVRWNNMVRTLRAQRLPAGNVTTMDTFDVTISGLTAVSNGTWSVEGDASGLYVENLNYMEGTGSLGMNLSGVGTTADIVNTTAAVNDMSALRYNDSSFIWFYIPVGYSARFTSFNLRRGSSASAYKQASVTTKADGTAFSDGWNFLLFNWISATTTGSPDDTKNTYRRFGLVYTAGTAINGCLVDAWSDSLGTLFEIEYYSENLFRTSAGAWIQSPTADTDLVNVSVSSYPIFLSEIMVDIVKLIRIGNERREELAELDLDLNGKSESRYLKNPAKKGAYHDYLSMFPSSSILTRTSYYNWDL